MKKYHTEATLKNMKKKLKDLQQQKTVLYQSGSSMVYNTDLHRQIKQLTYDITAYEEGLQKEKIRRREQLKEKRGGKKTDKGTKDGSGSH